MKFIDKLRGPALTAANARITELEEQLEKANEDARDGWDKYFKANTEKSELKAELDKAQKRQQKSPDAIIQGLWCDDCKHAKKIGQTGLGPLYVCEKQTPCSGYEARE